MNELKECPICSKNEFNHFLTCRDNTVSKKDFTIVQCSGCGFKFTNPIPTENKIGEYYKSEEYISHSSTKKGLINRLYHIVRNKTLKQKEGLISKEAKGKTLLDVGCGAGAFLSHCKNKGWNVHGLEPDETSRKGIKADYNINVNDITELHNLDSNQFDVITMWHVLEHVYHLKRDAAKIIDVLKDDGVLVIAVPNCESYDAKHYKENWAAYDVPRHLYHFTKTDVENLFSQFNVELKEVLPMKYDSYYVSMLSEKYKGGNNLKAFLTGWKSNRNADNTKYSSSIYILRKK